MPLASECRYLFFEMHIKVYRKLVKYYKWALSCEILQMHQWDSQKVPVLSSVKCRSVGAPELVVRDVSNNLWDFALKSWQLHDAFSLNRRCVILQLFIVMSYCCKALAARRQCPASKGRGYKAEPASDQVRRLLPFIVLSHWITYS
jgi:hypothetical protein